MAAGVAGLSGQTVVIAVDGEHTGRQDVLDALRCARAVRHALRDDYTAVIVPLLKRDFATPRILLKHIKQYAPVCVFNLFEGFSDDAQQEAVFAAILEKAQIPFTGNSSCTIGLCLNKAAVKVRLRRHGVNVPRGCVIKASSGLKGKLWHWPIFVKPVGEDASVGIDDRSLVEDVGALEGVVADRLKKFPQGILVEEFIGGREFNVGFLGGVPYTLLNVAALDYTVFPKFKPFLSYAAKWDRGSAEFGAFLPVIDKMMDKTLKNRIVTLASRAGAATGCGSYFRIDLREQGNELYVLDVNPNPDINIDSGFARQAYSRGHDFTSLVRTILRESFKRHGLKWS